MIIWIILFTLIATVLVVSACMLSSKQSRFLDSPPPPGHTPPPGERIYRRR